MSYRYGAKVFLTDVLISLELSIETIFSEARKYNNERELNDDGYIENLELIIEEIISEGYKYFSKYSPAKLCYKAH